MCGSYWGAPLIVEGQGTDDEEYSVVMADSMVCPSCREKYERTWAHRKERCCRCGAGVSEPVAWQEDYEREFVEPICEECLYRH